MPTRKKPASPNADAIDTLRRLGARIEPGEAPGAFTARLHGRWATVTVGSLALNVFEYNLEYVQEMFDATVHGESWKTFVAGDQSWTGRVRGYYTPSQAAYIASLPGASISTDAVAVLFTAFKSMQTSSPGTQSQRIWSGNALARRIGFDVPYGGMIVQELELQGTGFPTFGTGF